MDKVRLLQRFDFLKVMPERMLAGLAERARSEEHNASHVRGGRCNVERPAMKVVLLASLLLAGPWSGLVGAQQEAPPAPVRVAEVEKREIAPEIWVSGTVVSRNDARISAEVDGRITAVAEVGEYIEKGQPVAVIDDTRLLLLQREARSNVESLARRISFLKKEVGRSSKLARSKLTSETAVDQLQSDYDVAMAEHDAAQARLALIDDRLTRTRVAAPFGGYVTERLKMAGENVSEDTPVVRLVGLDNLEIEASAPLRYVRYVHKGMSLAARGFDARGSAVLRALVSIGADESRQFIMRLDFNGAEWLPGTPVQIAIPTEDRIERLVIPRDALVLRRDGAFVFLVSADNTAERIAVVPGIGAGDLISVSGALEPGDRVVIRGGERLRPGQPVRLADAKAPSS